MLQKNLATDIAIISNILIDKLYNYNLSHRSSQPSCLAGLLMDECTNMYYTFDLSSIYTKRL